MHKEIDKEMVERYELYLKLRDEMETSYRYRWARTTYYGTTEWQESTDKLKDILYKLRECWIERPELLEEV